MNNKQRKGFTLIELLAVVAIISLIFTIAIYFFANSMQTAKDKLNDVQKNLIITAAKDYVDEFRNKKDNWLENVNNNGEISFCISVASLVNYGFFKSDNKFIIENKDKLLVSVTIDSSKVYNYKIINNTKKDINAACLYSDINGTLTKLSGTIDIFNSIENKVGSLNYEIVQNNNTEYTINTNLNAELGSEEMEVDAPVYVALILDNSGSMIGDSWTNAKNASIELSKTIINNIDNSKVALIQYGDSPKLARNFQNEPLTSASFIPGYGGTNVSGSLDLAASLYKELKVPSYAKLYTILLYDGAVNTYSYLYGNKQSVYSSTPKLYYDNFLSAFNGTNNTYRHIYNTIINYAGTTLARYTIDSANYLKNTINSKLITIGYNFSDNTTLGTEMKEVSSIDNEFCNNSNYEKAKEETSTTNIMPNVELKTHQVTYPFTYNSTNKSINSTNNGVRTESYEAYELDLTNYKTTDELELAIDYTFNSSSYRDFFQLTIDDSPNRSMSKFDGSSACYTSGWSGNTYCGYNTTITKKNIKGGKKYYLHLYMEKNLNYSKNPQLTINQITYALINNETIYDSSKDTFNKSPIATLSTPTESQLVYETSIESNSLKLGSYGGLTGGYEKIDLSTKEGTYLLTANITSTKTSTGIIYISENSYQPVPPNQYRPLRIEYTVESISVCNQKNMRCFFTSFNNKDFNFTLEGGKTYYIHFIHESNKRYSNYVYPEGFKINQLSLIKIGDEIFNADLDNISSESCTNSSDIVSCLNKSTTYSFSFVPNNGSFISTNKEVKNSCSHNYSQIDLTKYNNSDNFIVSFDSYISSSGYSYSGGDYGNIIITTSPTTPNLNAMACSLTEDYNCVALLSGSKSNNNKARLKGGQKYYVHFMYCKSTSGSYQDYFSINKFTIYKGLDDKTTKFPVDKSQGFTDIINYKDYQFQETNNQLVSTNQGIYNSASYRYLKIDLSNYSNTERFIITVNSTGSGKTIVHPQSKIRFLNNCSKSDDSSIIACLNSNSPKVTVTGGRTTYLHFIYQKGTNNPSNDTYTINSVKVEHIASNNKKNLDLSKGLYKLKNYSFQEKTINNKKVYVSEKLDINTSAYSYFKLDLTKYSTDKTFEININSTSEVTSGNIYISPLEDIPYIYYNSGTDTIIRSTTEANKTKDFTARITGGKTYYIHFSHSSTTDTSSKFTINSITLSEVSTIGKNSYCYYNSSTEQITEVFANLSTRVIESIPKFEANKVKIVLTAHSNDDVTFEIEDKKTGKLVKSITKEIDISQLESLNQNKILNIDDNYKFILNTLPDCGQDTCNLETKIFDLQLEIYSANTTTAKIIKVKEEDLPTIKIVYKKGVAIN